MALEEHLFPGLEFCFWIPAPCLRPCQAERFTWGPLHTISWDSVTFPELTIPVGMFGQGTLASLGKRDAILNGYHAHPDGLASSPLPMGSLSPVNSLTLPSVCVQVQVLTSSGCFILLGQPTLPLCLWFDKRPRAQWEIFWTKDIFQNAPLR